MRVIRENNDMEDKTTSYGQGEEMTMPQILSDQNSNFNKPLSYQSDDIKSESVKEILE